MTSASGNSSDTVSTGIEGVEFRVFSSESSTATVETLLVPPVREGKVTGYATVLDEGKIRTLAQTFNFPENVQIIQTRPVDMANTPPMGFVAIYEDTLRSGLRLPLPSPFAELLRKLGLALW